MNYKETIDYMYAALPMFHREGKSAYKANLDNITKLSNILGNKHNLFRTIHVAGTNGKGSTCHMLASVLQHAGYKTGLYTSPHLNDFRERIKVNSEMISQQFVIQFITNNINLIETIQPSFFEMTTLMAFEYFASQQVDIAIIETGLGGRLDATNVITPVLSIITNISLDHCDILGNSLEKIAIEKAGIIKSKVPVIIGETQIETKEIFSKKAEQLNSEITFADENVFSVQQQTNIFKSQSFEVNFVNSKITKTYYLDLLGNYQQKNLCTVLWSIKKLEVLGLSIPLPALDEGLKCTAKTTGLRGRWEIIGSKPLIIADTGHNPGGLVLTMKQLSSINYTQLHIVIGFVNDKDVTSVLRFLPQNARYYFTNAAIPRAMESSNLCRLAQSFGLEGIAYTSVLEALASAKKNASVNDLIFVGGSTFVVAEILV